MNQKKILEKAEKIIEDKKIYGKHESICIKGKICPKCGEKIVHTKFNLFSNKLKSFFTGSKWYEGHRCTKCEWNDIELYDPDTFY